MPCGRERADGYLRAVKRPRLVDVAERAGVSRTTASAALSGRGRLAEQTRQHVLAVAMDMGYEVNQQAKNLRIQRTGAIAVYVPPDATGHEYYLAFVLGVVERAAAQEVPVVLIPNGTTEASLARDHVDGYIVIDAVDDDPQLWRILSTGKPVVAAEALPPTAPPVAGVVAFDHEQIVGDLLAHLQRHGSTRPAIVTPPLDTSWARQIDAAYDKWCARTGSARRAVTAPLLADVSGVNEAMDRLFGGLDNPDSVIVAQGALAAAVSSAITAKGLTVGRDVLVAACVDTVGARSAIPAVTAVDLVPGQHGRACADLLLQVLAGAVEVPAPTITLESELLERASTLGQ